jgi:uncharacterized membrane protein
MAGSFGAVMAHPRNEAAIIPHCSRPVRPRRGRRAGGFDRAYAAGDGALILWGACARRGPGAAGGIFLRSLLMSMLILGLILFLGTHSLRIVADGWRSRQVGRLGEGVWKGLYSIVSIAGFVLLVWGFAQARQHPEVLWVPPLWLRHVNALFTLLAFVLLAAAYVPRNHVKAAIGHPMLAAVKLWALGHLLATGMLHDVVLFGAFLAWAVADFTVSRRRDRRNGVTYPAGALLGDVLVVAIGVAAWAGFAFWLHVRWIGVAPFGI